MIRFVTVLLMIGLAGAPLCAQQAAATQQAGAQFFYKAELLSRIEQYEAAARKAESIQASDADAVKIYSSLGTLYLQAAMYPKAEDAMRRAIALLRHGSQTELAGEIGQLAVLHVAMGDLKQAEKDELEALQVRLSIADRTGIALTWNDLADVYIKERQFKKALDYAQRAMAVLAVDPDVQPDDRIAVRETLAFALCGVRQCGEGIPLFRDSVELAKTSFGADSLSAGLGAYLLGYACWQNGRMDEAAVWMQRGTARMKADWGWGQVLSVNAMQQYAKFLRQRGQMESASVAEREVRQMTAVVDARSFAGR